MLEFLRVSGDFAGSGSAHDLSLSNTSVENTTGLFTYETGPCQGNVANVSCNLTVNATDTTDSG